MYNAPLFFFDLETTGADIDSDSTVQIAYKRCGEDSEPSVGSLLLNPQQHIDPKASAVHGYTDDDVRDKPTFDTYADMLYSLADGAIWCGYNNYRFDVPIFKREFKRAGKKIPKPAGIIDCYKIFTHYYGKSRKRGQRTLMAAHLRYCGAEFDDAHDALADIEATYDVLDAQIDVHSDSLTLEYAMDISSRPELDIDRRGFFKFDYNKRAPICAMGKYAGVPMDKVPSSYYQWIADNDTFAPDTRNIALNAVIGVFPVWQEK